MTQNTPLSMAEIEKRLATFKFPEIDFVVGIASGGTFPAKMIAELLNKPRFTIEINYRSKDNIPLYEAPRLISMDQISLVPKSILLVDDVSVSGQTIKIAKKYLTNHKIRTFVLKGKADFVLFPEINTCVSWPWNSQNS
jgi:hypoxanthine phosphoribosyltransferase